MSERVAREKNAEKEELKIRERIARAGAGDQSQVDSAPSPADIARRSADNDQRGAGSRSDDG